MLELFILDCKKIFFLISQFLKLPFTEICCRKREVKIHENVSNSQSYVPWISEREVKAQNQSCGRSPMD